MSFSGANSNNNNNNNHGRGNGVPTNQVPTINQNMLPGPMTPDQAVNYIIENYEQRLQREQESYDQSLQNFFSLVSNANATTAPVIQQAIAALSQEVNSQEEDQSQRAIVSNCLNAISAVHANTEQGIAALSQSVYDHRASVQVYHSMLKHELEELSRSSASSTSTSN